MITYYFDSSALTKLATGEPETDAVASLSSADNLWITSDLARTEVPRAVTRQGGSVTDALEVLRNMVVIELDRDIYELAGRIQPDRLRSLDAIHVAAALSLGSDLTAIVTYDQRLAEAAQLNGIKVLSPGTEPVSA